MSTYVVGDIQGCLKPLQCLLDQVQFDPAHDQLWSLGDVINRGPESLATLRFLKSLGSSFKMVLGNHDLHLLAVYHGVRQPNKKDTLNEILAAPDVDELCHWLQQQPLLHVENKVAMVHAGIPHIWSIEQASALASEISVVLKSENAQQYFDHMYGNLPDKWSEQLTGTTRWRVITNYLTRMRYCDSDGYLNLIEKGPLESAPAPLQPWFHYRQPDGYTILFGHWASLQGQTHSATNIALDNGCVWGGRLTAYQLETGINHHCDCSPQGH